MTNEQGDRIIGGTEDIDYGSVSDFFASRSQDDSKKHKYNYVMYLDNTPDVAVMRDKQSKERISELLDIQKGQRVLDVGCGIGRWGEMLCPKGAYYVGVDGCAKMIDRAEDNLKAYDRKKLIVSNVQNLTAALMEAGETEPYDVILVVGVLMYINDSDVLKLFEELLKLSKQNTQICFIESMSDEERLTLRDVYSEELHQNYSAIYRSTKEFMEMMQNSFGGAYKLKHHELMDFKDGLQKKRAHVTMEHCVVWQATKNI